MNRAVRTLAVPAAVAAVLSVSACGSSTTAGSATSSTSHSAMPSMSGMSSTSSGSNPTTTSASSTSTRHNAADVTFSTGMVPHHAQAVQMATMALKQSTNTRIIALAKAIRAAQDPEIRTMTGWLNAWGMKTGMSGHPMSTDGMGAMMSTTEMAALGKATGPAFDRMWLQLMTRHHRGAVTMARTELARGASSDAKTLAHSIITSQDEQITQMRSMLSTAGG